MAAQEMVSLPNVGGGIDSSTAQCPSGRYVTSGFLSNPDLLCGALTVPIDVLHVSRFMVSQDGPGSLMDVCQGGVDGFYGGVCDLVSNEQRPIYGIDSRQAVPAVSSVDVQELCGDNSGRGNYVVFGISTQHVRKRLDVGEDTGFSEGKPGAVLGDFLGSAQRKDQQPMSEMSFHANGAESRSNHEQLLPSGDQFYVGLIRRQ